MRLWSIHPRYLDSKGLLGLWREALLAKAVLQDKTKGYKNHPQLTRFKEQENPVEFIDTYLKYIFEEAKKRGYEFAGEKIGKVVNVKLPVKSGQLNFEIEHLKEKLTKRDFEKLNEIESLEKIETHPMFFEIDGGIESWEKFPKR